MSGTAESPAELTQACQNGDRRAASRLISLLESSDRAIAKAASDVVSRLPLPKHTIGITGPPGAGKSTLVSYAVELYRKQNEKIGVLAVDPSSPFTGGALLGDRIRMSNHRQDAGVFIRSMGSRGASGGLAAAASDALRVLSAVGFQTVFIETVGAGQTETEIINLADTVCVVQVPGLGDDIQLMKMGMLEIADIFVVNKGDKPEAEDLKVQLEIALNDNRDTVCRAIRQLGKNFASTYTGPAWMPPVVLLSALRQTGGEALIDAGRKHLEFLRQPALATALKRNRVLHEIVWRAGTRFQDRLATQLAHGGKFATDLDACVDGRLSLDQVVSKIIGTV